MKEKKAPESETTEPAPEEPQGKINDKVTAFCSALSLFPPAAPLAGFIGSGYVAWQLSTQNNDSMGKKLLKTFAGMCFGNFMGFIGMLLPFGFSAIPTSAGIGGAQVALQTFEDIDRGQITAAGALRRVGYALASAIPIAGPWLANKMMTKESEIFGSTAPPEEKDVTPRTPTEPSGRGPAQTKSTARGPSRDTKVYPPSTTTPPPTNKGRRASRKKREENPPRY